MSDELLPSPAQVRCRLAIDLPLQLRGLLEAYPAAGVNPNRFSERYVAQRDSVLIKRLEEVIPVEELTHAIQGRSLDMDALARRVPAAHAMWVMITAIVASRAANDLANREAATRQ
jgi:hypothetical protein